MYYLIKYRQRFLKNEEYHYRHHHHRRHRRRCCRRRGRENRSRQRLRHHIHRRHCRHRHYINLFSASASNDIPFICNAPWFMSFCIRRACMHIFILLIYSIPAEHFRLASRSVMRREHTVPIRKVVKVTKSHHYIMSSVLSVLYQSVTIIWTILNLLWDVHVW